MSSLQSNGLIFKDPTVSSLSGNNSLYESNKVGGKSKRRANKKKGKTSKRKTNKRKTQKKNCWWSMMQ